MLPATGSEPVPGLGEDTLRRVVDAALDGIIVIDSCGTVLLFNAACEHLFGYSPQEVLGNNVSLLMTSPDRENHDLHLRDYLRSGTARIIGIGRDVTGRRKNGSTVPLRLSVGELRVGAQAPLFIGTLHDLTEQLRNRARIEELQTELMHVARASAVGEMGSTLAHELTQPLSAIVGFVEACSTLIARADREAPDRVHEYMSQAVAQAHRAGDIVRRLHEFTARGDTERTVEDINAVVEEILRLASVGAASEGIELNLDLASHLPPVLIDHVQIQQVVLNLVRNSMDALSGCESRTILIATQGRGDVVEVAVSDSGPGLPPEVRERLFAPFVSTKPDGLGIGLSICRTIVEAHGGEIAADTAPRDGTAFRFTIPVFADSGG